MEYKKKQTDVLIIGGGTAGCYAALNLGNQCGAQVLLAEKAQIKRSGCLAAGVNALNAYITKGKIPEDYVAYAKQDAQGIVREDLLLTMSQGLNRVTEKLEELGLVLLKDEQGDYVTRGERNIKINGENIKPLLASAVQALPQVEVLNRLNIIDYIVKEGKVVGAYGLCLADGSFYEITAKAVICATGGASGLYRPNNPAFSRHKMWYSPFNTGAGYAMGIRAGAEMTTFEMRFIALRCKDTFAPTGSIAQGVGAEQINARGNVYEHAYGKTTSERIYGTVQENLAGRGPCYLRTRGISPAQAEDLKKAYLNMAPSQTLKWLELGMNPSVENVEIEGTEPYIVGGHTASGYWVDTNRATTLAGLYAAGDVAGGCPQKYVTGALVEGEIAAKAAWAYCQGKQREVLSEEEGQQKAAEVAAILGEHSDMYRVADLEEAMQTVMDTYAGGIKTNYCFNEQQLVLAAEKIAALERLAETLKVVDLQELVYFFELKERLLVCQTVIAHLRARKETRWHCFCENLDYPKRDDRWLKYVNSKLVDGKITMIYRDLVGGDSAYEHHD